MDLAKALKRPPRFLDIFPYRDAAIAVVTFMIMFFVMFSAKQSLARDYQVIHAKNQSVSWAKSMGLRVLHKEKQDRLGEVNAITKFLKTRIVWSNYLKELPALVPKGSVMQGFRAEAEYVSGKKKGGKKSKRNLVLRGMAPFSKEGLVPPEISNFLENIRNAEVFKKEFPVSELVSIIWRKEDGRNVAMYSVLCLEKKKVKKKAKVSK